MISPKLSGTLVIAFLTICGFLSYGFECQAQGKQSIIILRSSGTDTKASGCEGTTDISYQIVTDIKINNKDEVRLLNGFSASGPSSIVGREPYDRSGKIKSKDLFVLKWAIDDVLYAVSVSGQAAVVVVPDNMKPQKNAAQPLTSFYGVTITGDAKEGKQKRKVSLGLREAWKIYFVAEGANPNDALFTHAAEEQSVVLWEAFLRKTNNYRSSEANSKMRDALIVCARADLTRFVDGDYSSLAKARERVNRAQSIRDDEASRQLTSDIQREQQKVEDARSKAEQLIKAEKWDEAIDATEPIRKYLDTWPDLNQMYKHALEQSHEIHLNAGDKALVANQLEAALKDCSLAKSRLPNSDRALECVCKARNEIAIRDSKKNRQVNKPKDAKELLERQMADSECKQDPRMAAELKLSKCEYAKQLYNESRQLLGVGSAAAPQRSAGPRRRAAASTTSPPGNVNVKAITMQNKKDFRDAREKLVLANEICNEANIQSLLVATNRQLSGFCVAEATKALQRNDNGTAYVYLQKAQGYTPENGQIPEMLIQAKEKFQEQTRVNVGVVFNNKSGNGAAGELLGQVIAAVESSSTSAGLSNPTVLEGNGAEAGLRAIQAGRPLNSPTVIFFGDLLTASARVERNSYSASSTYSRENPEWRRWSDIIDAKSREIDACKKVNPDAACNGLRAEREQMRNTRGRVPRYLQEPYSFSQTDFRLQGGVRMSFRSTDSISRGTGEVDTLSADVSGQCQQREGVHDNDSRGNRNSICQISDEGTYLSQMFTKSRNDAQSRAVGTLRELPSSYYRRAQSSANNAQAVESYLRFLFLTNNKSGSEAEQAKAFLISYDPELSTDGVVR
jgi:hypothetical protein